MVVSDTHFYSPVQDFSQTKLYELAMAAIQEEVDFIFITGDLIIYQPADSSMLDSLLQDWRFVLDTLGSHDIRLYACRGNNDINSGYAWDSLFSGEYAFPQNGPEGELNRTYAFSFNNILFLSLDQYVVPHRINQSWMDGILEGNQLPHVFAAGHEPAFKLYHSGIMGMYPAERDQFWKSLSEAGTKVFFCGHDHFYDHAIFEDSTGLFPPVHQVIVGTGGGGLHSDSEYDGENGRWKPNRIFHKEEHGYVLVEVNGMDVRMTWKHRTDRSVFEEGGDAYEFTESGSHIPSGSTTVNSLANFPNPFCNGTTITYLLSSSSVVEMVVRNVLGKKVATLAKGKKLPGSHQVTWNTAGVPPGIYFCELRTMEATEILKMLLIN